MRKSQGQKQRDKLGGNIIAMIQVWIEGDLVQEGCHDDSGIVY